MVGFLSLCVALAFSAFYELVEWWAAFALGQGADEFLALPTPRSSDEGARARYHVAVRFTVAALALVVGIFALPLKAQPADKVARIGYLTPHSPDMFRVQAFRQGLRDLGWVEGRNLIIDYRSADGKFDRLSNLAGELVALNVQVIVAAATVPALAAKRASQSIPIVFTHVSDPVGTGLVSSFARPGGNVTGFTHLNAGLGPKRLELLKQVVPNLSRVVALWHPGGLGERTDKLMVKETEDAARALGLQLQFVPVHGLHEIEAAFSSVGSPVILLPSPIFRNEPRLLAELAAKHRVPAVYFDREFAEVGGLMAYGADMGDVVRGAAGYVDRILKGARPGDLPVAQATRFELLINLKTAKRLGLTIPPAVSIQADQLIQ
jgi:putative ABC transport system substrate-binding protein